MQTPINTFWWRWLVTVTIGTALFGIAFFALPHQIQSLYSYLLFNTTDARTLFGEDYHFITFIYVVLGAVFFGWAVSLLITLFTSYRKGYREGWLNLAVSIGVWFVIDSTFSVAMGYTINAIVNIGFAILFAIPLAATYRDFYGVASQQSRSLARE